MLHDRISLHVVPTSREADGCWSQFARLHVLFEVDVTVHVWHYNLGLAHPSHIPEVNRKT